MVYNRRLNVRRTTPNSILVLVVLDGVKHRGHVIDMNMNGGMALYFPETLNLHKHSRFEMTIAIKLNNGVTRLHFKSVVVIYVAYGKIGVITGPRNRSNTISRQ